MTLKIYGRNLNGQQPANVLTPYSDHKFLVSGLIGIPGENVQVLLNIAACEF